MKIFLVLEYKQDKGNVWAEVQAFTSPKEQEKAYLKAPKGADVEKQEVFISKRTYKKPEVKDVQPT